MKLCFEIGTPTFIAEGMITLKALIASCGIHLLHTYSANSLFLHPFLFFFGSKWEVLLCSVLFLCFAFFSGHENSSWKCQFYLIVVTRKKGQPSNKLPGCRPYVEEPYALQKQYACCCPHLRVSETPSILIILHCYTTIPNRKHCGHSNEPRYTARCYLR